MRILLRLLSENRDLRGVYLGLALLSAALPALGAALAFAQKQIIDRVVVVKQPAVLMPALALYALLWLAMAACQTVGAPLRTFLDERLQLRLRQRLFEHSSSLAVAFSNERHSGETLALFSSDTPVVASLLSTVTLGILSSAFSITIASLSLLTLNWKLALAAGLVPPLLSGAAAILTRPLRPLSRQAQAQVAAITQGIHENLAGLREVVAFGQVGPQSARFAGALGQLLRLRMRIACVDAALNTGQSLFALSATLAILGYGGYLVTQGQTTVGTLVAMQALFSMIFQPAGQALGMFGNANKALASAERVYAFLDQQPRVPECPHPRVPAVVRGEIEFRNVSFGYSAAGEAVLREVSFTAHPGELVAVVGPSGAGKSTLAGLLARFYDPSSGSVLFDGVDLREWPLDVLRSRIGLVFQDPFLFATSIRDNIAFGLRDATESEVVAAAQAANAWEFISRLPEGLDTQVGQNGVLLSEGEKQRLTIARAIIRSPRVLILDEPTSALDARSEQLLGAVVRSLAAERTTFVIAHRLSTIRHADQIIVLDRGRIRQLGTHAELLRQGGLYAELCALQLADGEEASALLEQA